jgi:hypothetical protein
MHTGMVLEGLVFWYAAQRHRKGSHVARLKRMCGLADFIFKKNQTNRFLRGSASEPIEIMPLSDRNKWRCQETPF